MKRILTASILAALPLLAADEPKVSKPAAAVPAEAKAAEKKPERPRIEVCFVLDTTGSMGGLIEGAKQKIWGIANDIIAAKPTPEVRFSLVAYRDRGDEYVTKRVELTDDLDAVYAKLRQFQAAGGGDEPESVSEALDEAVQKIEWSQDRSVLKIIYLVGDAPPQQYPDGKDWKKVCEAAVKRDLIVNTIQCGANQRTTPVWRDIAGHGEGAYVAIAQDGAVAVIETPQDKELAELSVKIGSTFIACGTADQRRFALAKQEAADFSVGGATGVATAPKAALNATADRAAYNWNTGRVVQGGNELLDALKEGRMKLAEVKAESLPEEYQKLSPEELKDVVAKKQAERETIQKRIGELSKEREAFLTAERARLIKEHKADGFDAQVAATLREQAKKKGIKYE